MLIISIVSVCYGANIPPKGKCCYSVNLFISDAGRATGRILNGAMSMGVSENCGIFFVAFAMRMASN